MPALRLLAGVLPSLLMTLTLAGCSDTAEDHLRDYHQRVARVLNEELPPETRTPRIARVAVTHFALALPDYRINLLELLSLNDCRISQAIAQKNSTLGRLAAASQSLIQEMAILRDGDECVLQLQQDDPQLAQQLQTALQQKYDARLHYWWNAWVTADEWQKLIASAAQPLDWPETAYEKPAHISLTLNALDYAIAQGEAVAGGDFTAPDNMESQLQQLMLGETFGRWLASAYLLISELNRSAAIIENRLARKPLCPTGQETPDAKILHNVFMKYYAAQVQPYISLTDQTGKSLLARTDAMTALLAEQPPQAFNHWYQQVVTVNETFNQANKRHVQAWQTILRQCGLMPGS
ncbi:MAG: hypothetical protein CMI03_11630 [Oceanospirillaceae bacterium]|uniref:DUF3080 family protein n=1 Tax=unclassified Thalassolituus TaxID=2624967 RepID=UPI000C0AA22F|nr:MULTISPECIES: DUF3080 family protein [unclassified Thalassolituus]MAK90581.1 hypothetical protein [Thalassolituus sp.]MBL36546.1 hypothetical protein [Oceanospirillaceae bacterium]MBS53386.1 hypothetical protein [Oceanospirillaceae bacterium]|tara:strand:+ start:2805 stop:3857 length:1053 start_codon:yes stop_codon:yes gene_type:complete